MEASSKVPLSLLIVTAIIALALGGLLGGYLNPRIVTFTTTLTQTKMFTNIETTTQTKTITQTKILVLTTTAEATTTSTSKPTQTQPTSGSSLSSTTCTFTNLRSETSTIEMEILKVVRGGSTNDIVKKANMFNPTPPRVMSTY